MEVGIADHCLVSGHLHLLEARAPEEGRPQSPGNAIGRSRPQPAKILATGLDTPVR